MAKGIGVTTLTISQWETGFRQPSQLAIKAVEMLKELYGPNNLIHIQREAKERFNEINQKYFNNELRRKYQITFSKNMRKTYGRAFPEKKAIYLSLKHLREKGWEEVEQTLKHEMVHCWLYEKGRPLGHGREFNIKLKEVQGVKETS